MRSTTFALFLLCIVSSSFAFSFSEKKLKDFLNKNVEQYVQSEEMQETLKNFGEIAQNTLEEITRAFHNLGLSNLEIQQQFYNGFYNQQGLANPTYIAQCYTEVAAADFVAFAPGFLKKASSVLSITAAFTDLQTFTNDQNTKYPEITECITGNPEIAALSAALGIKNPATIQKTIQDYITANLISTTNAFGDANKSWKSPNYPQSGSQVSAWVKKAAANNV